MRQNHQLDLPYKNESNQYKDLLKQFQAEPDCPNRFCFCNGFYGSQKDEDQIFNLLKLCLLPDVEEDTELILCDVSWNGLFAGKAFLRFQQYFPNITVLICSVSAFRNKALEILINISGETASINLDTGVYLSWSGTNYPTYVPEGYELVSVSLTDDIKQMEFRNNENKSLYFMQQSNKVTGMIDSENLQEQEEIVIGDTIGYYSYKNGVSVMTWDYRDNIYSLQGEIGKDEMVLIAVSTQH